MKIGKRSNKITINKPNWHGLDSPLALTLLKSTPADTTGTCTRVRQKCAETGHRLIVCHFFFPRESITKDSKAELRGTLYIKGLCPIYTVHAYNLTHKSYPLGCGKWSRKERLLRTEETLFKSYPPSGSNTRPRGSRSSLLHIIFGKLKREYFIHTIGTVWNCFGGTSLHTASTLLCILHMYKYCFGHSALETDRFSDIWAWKGKRDRHLHFSLWKGQLFFFSLYRH